MEIENYERDNIVDEYASQKITTRNMNQCNSYKDVSFLIILNYDKFSYFSYFFLN